MSEVINDNQPVNLKVPPNSLEAEQAVLGGLMLNNEAWFELVSEVRSQDFYQTRHQIIFDAMMTLANADEPIDAVTVAEQLRSKGLLDKSGGVIYLAELAATQGVGLRPYCQRAFRHAPVGGCRQQNCR